MSRRRTTGCTSASAPIPSGQQCRKGTRNLDSSSSLWQPSSCYWGGRCGYTTIYQISAAFCACVRVPQAKQRHVSSYTRWYCSSVEASCPCFYATAVSAALAAAELQAKRTAPLSTHPGHISCRRRSPLEHLLRLRLLCCTALEAPCSSSMPSCATDAADHDQPTSCPAAARVNAASITGRSIFVCTVAHGGPAHVAGTTSAGRASLTRPAVKPYTQTSYFTSLFQSTSPLTASTHLTESQHPVPFLTRSHLEVIRQLVML
jgi:hypothetical protein